MPAQAPAAPAEEPAVAPAAAAPPTDPEPSAPPAPESEAEYNPFALLDQNGSKEGDENLFRTDRFERPIEDAPQGDAPIEAEAPPEEEPELDPPAAEAPVANNYRLNLKDAADKERKAQLVVLLRNEPGIDLAEAMRRVGIAPLGGQPKETPPAQPAAPPAEAPADPAQKLQEEIKTLRTQAKAAREEFDYNLAFELQDQISDKQVELAQMGSVSRVRAESQAQEQAAKAQTAVTESWGAVAGLYPDAGVKGTPLYAALEAKIAQRHQANPGYFNDPDWPIEMTAACATKLGIQPKAPAASAPAPPPGAAKTSAAVQPRKPSAPVPSPAAGHSRSVDPALLNRGGDYNPFDYLDAHGTKAAQL